MMNVKKGIVLCCLASLGLMGCSSSPKSGQGSSTWGVTNTGEAASAEKEAPITEIVITEPEIVRSEMWAKPVSEPETIPEKPVSRPVREEPVEEPVKEVSESAHLDIMSAPKSAYAVQVYAGKARDNVSHYMNSHNLGHMQIIKTDRGGEIFYVLVSIHGDKASALQTANDIEQSTGSKPWVRSVSGLKKIAIQ